MFLFEKIYEVEHLFWTFGISNIEVLMDSVSGDNGYKMQMFWSTRQHGDCTEPLGHAKFVTLNLSHGLKNIDRSKFYQWCTHLGKTFL